MVSLYVYYHRIIFPVLHDSHSPNVLLMMYRWPAVVFARFGKADEYTYLGGGGVVLKAFLDACSQLRQVFSASCSFLSKLTLKPFQSRKRQKS